jgi:pimeloyl-ACP methyl ester carboxylesterase
MPDLGQTKQIRSVLLNDIPADFFWRSALGQFGIDPGTDSQGHVVVAVYESFTAVRYRAGEPFSVLSPDDRVGEVKVPFLILHGDRDRDVSPDHASILARGAGVDPVFLEGEGHNDLLGKGPVHQRVLGFLERVSQAT